MLTTVLIAVQQGQTVGVGQMDPAVQTFLYAVIATISLFVSLVQYRILDDREPFNVILDAWTKLVGVVAAGMAAWSGLSGESVDLRPYRYLFAFLDLVVVLLIAAATALILAQNTRRDQSH